MSRRAFALLTTALFLVVTVIPASEAWSRTSFDFERQSRSGGSGAITTNRGTGVIDISYNVQGPVAIAHWTAALGSQYNVNSGDLLPSSYNAAVSASAYANGWGWCRKGVRVEGFAQVDVWLNLYRYRWTGASWEQLNKWQFPEKVGHCRTVPFDGTFTVDRTFSFTSPSVTFDEGRIYRFDVEVEILGNSDGTGQAIVDFTAAGPEHIDIRSISVPNQRPFTRFNDLSRSYLANLISGTTVSGRSCDFDGVISSHTLSVSALTLGPTSDTESPNSACDTIDFSTIFLAPGSYSGSISARDNDGSTNSDSGTVTISLTLSFTQGDPDVKTIDKGSLLDVVTMRAILNEDDSSEGATFTTKTLTSGKAVDGGTSIESSDAGATGEEVVLKDTLGGLQPSLGQHEAIVEYDRLNMKARVVLDGEEKWAGAVLQKGLDWWEIEPLEV